MNGVDMDSPVPALAQMAMNALLNRKSVGAQVEMTADMYTDLVNGMADAMLNVNDYDTTFEQYADAALDFVCKSLGIVVLNA